MDHKRFVLGIGNPGPDYDGTRHNVGFEVLDRFAEQNGLAFRRLERRDPEGRKLFGGKVKAHVAEGEIAGESFLLVKPLTYVNLSGDVAGPLLRVAEQTPAELFVILDDLNLPLGRIRIRPSGSSGGHNGLKSIEAALQSRDYPRLRLGIGAPGGSHSAESHSVTHSATVDHVLGPFSPDERDLLNPTLDECVAIVGAWLSGNPTESLMGRHNGFEARASEARDSEARRTSLDGRSLDGNAVDEDAAEERPARDRPISD